VSRILAKASLVNSILSSITSITVHITALQH
jgi:hypothetical protein